MSEPVTPQCRLAKFSMVGAMGIVVQLAVLSLLTTITINYLVATIVAVEIAILHNFVWHHFFTWPDRQGGFAQSLSAFLRFNLSNGLISLAGNVLLMRLFSGEMRLPLLLANLISIAVCALANFAISDHWVFTPEAKSSPSRTATVPASGPDCVAQRGDR